MDATSSNGISGQVAQPAAPHLGSRQTAADDQSSPCKVQPNYVSISELERLHPPEFDQEPPVSDLTMTITQKTTVAKPNQIPKKWFHVDAEDQVLGRLASDIAVILMGKHRPTYTPHVDTGDYVVVTNADKVVMTGEKMNHRHYAWYTGYTGQKLESYSDRLERKPEDLIFHAVRRMLPKNKLARHMLDKLKIYAGPEHPHQAQQVETLESIGKKKSG